MDPVPENAPASTKLMAAFAACPAIPLVTIDTVVDDLIGVDLDNLATMPGSPARVLCSQFLYYIKSNYKLRSELTRLPGQMDLMSKVIMQAAEAAKKKSIPRIKEDTSGRSSARRLQAAER